MSVIKGLAGVLGDRVPSGGRGLPGLRFAGEGIQGEGNQALLEDVSDRALQGRQPRLPPAIRDTRAAPPLQLDTPAPRNAEKPLVLDVTADDPPRNAADERPLAVEVFELQDQPSQTKPHKQSVEEASAAVMNSCFPEIKQGLRKRQQRQPTKRKQRQKRKRQQRRQPRRTRRQLGPRRA